MKILISLLFFIGLSSAYSQKFEYREAADVFQIVDQLSHWHGTQKEVLPRYWKKTLEVFPKDEELLKSYRELRLKVHNSLKVSEEESIFGSSYGRLDFFSHAFYSSKSVGQALKKLQKKLTQEEIKFLVEFFNHFKSRISIMAKESTLFRGQLKGLNKVAGKQKLKRNIKGVKKFLGLKGRKKTQLLLAWWPKDQKPWVHVQGNFIVYHTHPHWDVSDFDGGYLLEELTVSYLTLMGANNKKNYSKKFLDRCPISKKMKTELILSRPLAVVLGRILPEVGLKRKHFTLEKEWNLHPWVQTYSKLLFPTVQRLQKKRDGIQGLFITQAASACRDLMVLKDYFKAFNL